MKNYTLQIVSLLIILSLVFYIVIHKSHDNHIKQIKDTQSEIKTESIELDSLFQLADDAINKELEQRHIDHDKIFNLDEDVKSKNLTIEQKIVELNKLLIEVEEARADAEQMKDIADLERLNATRAKEISEKLIYELKEEKSAVINERNKLKRECLKLNNLLGNDYNIAPPPTEGADSLVNVPDTIIDNPISEKKRRNKKRKNK
jgi:hypothetical protein